MVLLRHMPVHPRLPACMPTEAWFLLKQNAGLCPSTGALDEFRCLLALMACSGPILWEGALTFSFLAFCP